MKEFHTNLDGTVIVTGQDDPLTEQDYERAIQNLLDTTAQSKGYIDIVSACSYAGYPNKFQAEAISLGTFRSSCWDMAYTILAEVQSGAKTAPTLPELLALMPTYTGV